MLVNCLCASIEIVINKEIRKALINKKVKIEKKIFYYKYKYLFFEKKRVKFFFLLKQ